MSEAKSSLCVELYQGRSWRRFERHFLVIVTQRIDDIWHLKETRPEEKKCLIEVSSRNPVDIFTRAHQATKISTE